MISKNGPLGCDRGGIQGLYSYFIRKCQKIAAPDAPDSSKTFFKSPGPYLNRQKKHDFLRSVLAPLNQDSGAQDIDFCEPAQGEVGGDGKSISAVLALGGFWRPGHF